MCCDLCGKRSLLTRLCHNNLVCLPGCLQACSFYGIVTKHLREKREVLKLQSTAQAMNTIEPNEQEVPFVYIIYGKMATTNRTTQALSKDLVPPFNFLKNATEINIIGMNANSSISKVLCVLTNNSHICKHMEKIKMRTMKQRSHSSKMLAFSEGNNTSEWTRLVDVQHHKLIQESQDSTTSSTRAFSSASRLRNPVIIVSVAGLVILRLCCL